MSATCHSTQTGKIVRLNKKTILAIAIVVLLYLVSFFPFFEPLNNAISDYFSLIWWAVLLGLFLGGVIDYFIPDEFVAKYLGSNKRISLFFAVVAGFLLSACSHGILALSIQLYKKGAGIPAVITFLMASPWANLPVTILLFSFFGLKALAFILMAMVIALITGFVFVFLEKRNLIEQSKKADSNLKYNWKNVKKPFCVESFKGVYSGAISLANMVLWWIIIGFIFASLMQAYVPAHIFMNYFGPTFFGLVATLIFATILEVCSEGSAPIAFELFRQTGALGNPFVFLMAGVATDYTEIGLIWSNIGKKTAIWLPVVATPQIVLVAWMFNLFL